MRTGRPLAFDPDHALDQAVTLFWQQGYEATSLQQLLAAMGLSKSSLYQTFGDKHRLFERCIERYRERTGNAMADHLRQSESGLGFLRDTLNAVASEADDGIPKGCLIMNSATEFSQNDPRVAELVTTGRTLMTDILRQAVRRAMDEGDIPPHHNADALAHYLMTTLAGLNSMVKAGMDGAAARQVAQTAIAALQ